MILDAFTTFSEAQAETTTGAHDSTNVLDFGSPGDAIYPLELYIRAAATVTSAGAATVTFALQTSDAESSGYSTIWSSAVIGKADLAEGEEIKAVIPAGMKQYAKLVYTIGTAALTAGAFDAYLVLATQRNL